MWLEEVLGSKEHEPGSALNSLGPQDPCSLLDFFPKLNPLPSAQPGVLGTQHVTRARVTGFHLPNLGSSSLVEDSPGQRSSSAHLPLRECKPNPLRPSPKRKLEFPSRGSHTSKHRQAGVDPAKRKSEKKRALGPSELRERGRQSFLGSPKPLTAHPPVCLPHPASPLFTILLLILS